MTIGKHINSNITDRIGIWKARERDGEIYFERDVSLYREYSYWAWSLSIPLTSNRFRTILIGDSVGMGHFYQPLFTPALYLEKVLNENMSDNQAEVVDLSCKSLDDTKFREICLEAMVLKPNALIVFLGNKWWDDAFRMTDNEIRDYISSVNDVEKYNSLSQFIKDRLRLAVTSLMAFLSSIRKQYDIPIMFVIPEVNLKYWENNRCGIISNLNGGKPSKWAELKKSAKAAQKNGNYRMLEEAAREMLEITTCNPIPYEILAKCEIRRGNICKAKVYYRSAFNTQIYGLKNIPSSISVVRELILEAAPKYGIQVLDLQDVFDRHLSGGIPGRDMFLDSYHLTADGIRVAMDHAALKLLRQIYGNEYRIECLKEVNMKADENDRNKVLGKAHLLAAVYCQHEGNQSYNLLYYHCSEALRYWPESAKAMQMYIELITAKVPWFIHRNYTELSKIDFWPVFPDKSQLFGLKSMENELIDAMVEALKTVNIEIKEEVDNARIKGFGPLNGKINLLEPYYHKKLWDCNRIHEGLNIFKDYGYYNEIDIESIFYLVADGKNNILLEITLRIPEEDEVFQEAVIKLNDIPLTRLKVCGKWRDYRITIPKHALGKAIINEIAIEWPVKDKTKWEIEDRLHGKSSDWGDLAQKLLPFNGNIIRFEARYL